jgi:hypothetical protein
MKPKRKIKSTKQAMKPLPDLSAFRGEAFAKKVVEKLVLGALGDFIGTGIYVALCPKTEEVRLGLACNLGASIRARMGAILCDYINYIEFSNAPAYVVKDKQGNLAAITGQGALLKMADDLEDEAFAPGIDSILPEGTVKYKPQVWQ